jgi:hypothetical protein
MFLGSKHKIIMILSFILLAPENKKKIKWRDRPTAQVKTVPCKILPVFTAINTQVVTLNIVQLKFFWGIVV